MQLKKVFGKKVNVGSGRKGFHGTRETRSRTAVQSMTSRVKRDRNPSLPFLRGGFHHRSIDWTL
jgi:hypothetical protein